MIIEFFGAPGAGKSPLMRALLRSDKGVREIQTGSRVNVLKGVLLFVLRHPLSFFIWMYALCTNHGGLFRYKLGLTLRSFAACTEARSMPHTSRVVVDESLLQRMLTIFDDEISHSYIHFLLKHTPMPDLVVVVEGGDFRRFTRKGGYEQSPRVRQGRERFERWQMAVEVNAKRIADMLPTYTRVMVHKRGELMHDLATFPQEIERQLKSVV